MSTQKKFLQELCQLMSKYKAEIRGDLIELYMQKHGFVGYLEDNIDTVDIVLHDECILSCKKNKDSLST